MHASMHARRHVWNMNFGGWMRVAPPLSPSAAAALLLLLSSPAAGVVFRPSVGDRNLIDFETLTGSCTFPDGVVVREEYTALSVRFSGPGFGSLNGGVAAGRCVLASGLYPPLGNHSLDGNVFLGFSALHRLAGRTGKPIAIRITDPAPVSAHPTGGKAS